jgi:hypothetical protein
MRLIKLPLVLVVALAIVALAGVEAASAKSCSPARYPGDGYFTSLNVSGTSCARGREVQRSHYRCRVRNGGRDGRCRSRVEGYRCREERFGRTSAEYNARVRCTRGSAVIRFTYQQNI